MMAAVVLTPAQVETFWQPGFMATAFHIVQQDRTGTIAKVGLSLGCTSRTTTNLPAHYVGIVHVPVIITHCSPNSFVEDLYPTWAATVAVHQTNGWFGWTKIDIMTQLGSNRIWANVSQLENVTDTFCVFRKYLITFCQSHGGNIGCNWWLSERHFICHWREDLICKKILRSRPSHILMKV